jgi:mono/diheme cytochrome c family protein
MTHTSLLKVGSVLLGGALLASACNKSGTTAAAPAPAAPVAAPSQAPASPGSAMRAAGALPEGVTAQMVATGDSLFHARSCRGCHGGDAKGAQNGPDLTSGHFMHIDGSYSSIVAIITSGVPKDSIKDPSHRFGMQPRGGGRGTPLSDDGVRDIAAYVYSLSHR